jgi:uncharacterized protein YijF (DUF1287 family)
MTYFSRRGWSVQTSKKAAEYLPGDVVAWDLSGGVTHIGIISDQRASAGNPLVIHNIGQGVQKEDILFAYEIIGHCRPQFSIEEPGTTNAVSPRPDLTR